MAIRETLELDISQALSDLQQVGQGLETTASDFQQALTDAISTASSEQLTLSFDESGLESDITGAIAAVEGLVTTDIDESSITDSVQQALFDVDTLVTVDVDADVAAAQAEIDGLQGDTITIEVDADTEPAITALDDLNGAAADAGGGLNDLSGAASSIQGPLQSLAGSGAGGIGGVVGALEAIPGAGAIAGVGLGGLAAITDGFVQKAISAESATRRLNQIFGESAVAFDNIDVGSLSTSLSDLTLKLGSSTSGVRNAAASFGQLGIQAGIPVESVQATTESLIALASRAVALNPNLGEVGDVADRMGKALARGGRASAPFGIALTAAEINARALADTGKATARELTQYDKAAAGAAIATEKLGDHLGEDIAKGAENPQLALKSMQVELNRVQAELGKELQPTFFELLRAALPLIESSLRTVGDLAKTLLPPLIPVIEVFSQIVGEIGSALGPVLQDLAPVLKDVATQIGGALVDAVIKLAPQMPEIAKAFGDLTVSLVELLPSLIPLIPPFTKLLTLISVTSFTAMAKGLDAIMFAVDAIGKIFGPVIEAVSRFFDLLLSGKFEEIGKLFDGFRDTVGAGFDKIEEFFGRFPAFLGGVVDNVENFVRDVGDKLGGLVDNIENIFGEIPGLFGGLVENVENFVGSIPEKLGGVVDRIEEVITGIPGKIKDLLESAANEAGIAAGLLARAIVDPIIRIKDDIVSAFDFATTIPGKLAELKDLILGFFTTTIPEVLGQVGELERTFFSWAVNVVTGIPGKLLEFKDAIIGFFTDTIPNVAGQAAALFGAFFNWIIDAGSQIGLRLLNFGSQVINFVVGLPGQIASAISGAAGAMTGWAGDAARSIGGKLEEFASETFNFVRNLGGRIAENASGLKDSLFNLGKDVLGGLLRGITNAANSLGGFFGGLRDQFTNGFKEAFGIHSPARVMIPIGEQIAAGVGVGIQAGTDDVVGQIDSLVASAQDAASNLTLTSPDLVAGNNSVIVAPAAASAANDQPLVGSLTVEVTAAPGMTQAEAAALGNAAIDAAANRLQAIRAEVLRA